MADVNAEIGVNIDTSAALAQLKALQREISRFHSSVAKSSDAAALAQRDLQKNFINGVNSIKGFSAELRTVKTTAENFTDSLERNKFSMREYFRYSAASTRTFGKFFKSEFDTVNKVAIENVKRLQTQYIKMGRDANGAMRAIAIMPTKLDMSNMSTQIQLSSQRQAIFNQLVKQGSTNLLNFGKNTQWAGRQLMVGFTIPLMGLGAVATRTFMDMETAAIKFKKVYGDLFTAPEETQFALESIQSLGREFTKFGIAVSDTVSLAAEAAAAGFSGTDLQAQVTQATRLQVLGQVEQQKALETTISLQNAFRISSNELANAINFLNAVENQTVVSLDDITTAIPKAAPIVRELGGDVKDLAFFMAAMKEGGINASEGANALKSGLASLINPTDKAKGMLMDMGINIDQIVESNVGNLKATVIEFAKALDGLSNLQRQRAIEQLFGKFQQARLSALFDNVIRDGNQASRVLDLANASMEDLALLAEKELGITADSAMNKFRKSIEDLKVALVPVGQVFLEVITPILDKLSGIIEWFNGLSDSSKKAITKLVFYLGGIAPVLLMTIGLLSNFVANGIKGLMLLRNGFLRLTGQSKILGEQTNFLSVEQQEAVAAAASLDQSHMKLQQTFTGETAAVKALIAEYQRMVVAQQNAAARFPGMMVPGYKPAKKFAKGRPYVVPGIGNQDTEPALLTPGETVIPAEMSKKYASLINGMIAGNIPGYNTGRGRKAAYWTKAKRDQLLDELGLAPDQRARIPLEATSAAYSEAGIIAPRDINRGGGIGMTREYLQSPLGRAATMVNLEVGLEDLGLSATRMSEVLDDVAPQITRAIDDWDGSLEGWQRASRTAMDNIEQSPILSPDEKNIIRRRLAPVNPDDYTIGSNVVTEVSRRRGTTRNERVDAQRAYGSQRAMDKLRARGFGLTGAYDFAHMPGYEKIPASSVRVAAPTVAGVALTAQQQAILAREKAAFETFRREQDALATRNAESVVASTARGAGTNSPSRKTIPIGEDIARGLQVGMANQIDETRNMSSKLGNTAVSGLINPKTGRPFGAADIASRTRLTGPQVASVAGPLILPGQSQGKPKGLIVPGKPSSFGPPPLILPSQMGLKTPGGLVDPRTGGYFPPVIAAPSVANETREQRRSRFGRVRGAVSKRFSRTPKEQGTAVAGKRKIGRMSPGAGMGISGLVFALSMLPGTIGKLASSIMPAVFALQAMSMIKTPAQAAVAAVAAVGVGLYMLNKSAKETAQKMVDSANMEAEARYGSAESVRQFAEFSGRSAPSAREFSRNNRQLISASGAAVSRFSEFYGQKGNRATQVMNAAVMRGPEAGIQAAAIDVAQRAAIFGLGPADIAANIKAAADLIGVDQVKLKAQVQTLLSPDGKDITKEPLTIKARMELLESQATKNIEGVNASIGKLSEIKLPQLDQINAIGSAALTAVSPLGGIGNIRRLIDVGKRVSGGETFQNAATTMSYQELKQSAGWQQGINESYSGGFGSEAMGALKQVGRNVLGFNYDLDVVKEFNKIQTAVSSSTMQLSIAFTQQKESLGLLNQQYADGLITKEEYDAAFKTSFGNFEQLEESSKKLVDSLMEIDPKGELAADALKGLGNEAFGALKKSNPALFKKVSKSLEDLDGAAQIDIMMGYAKGSLTILDVAVLPDILSKIDGQTATAALKIIAESNLSEGAKGVISSSVAKSRIEALDKEIAKTTDVSDRARLLEERGRMQVDLAKALKAEEEAAKVGQGTFDSDKPNKQISGQGKFVNLLDKEIKALHRKRDALKEINDEMDRQNQYAMKQMDLMNRAVKAKMTGDYLEAATLQQESLLEGAKFTRDSKIVQMDKIISMAENRKERIDRTKKMTPADKTFLGNLKSKNYSSIVPMPNTPNVGFGAKDVQADAMSNQVAGGSVYNISMNVTGSNAEEIASKVIAKINNATNKNNKSNNALGTRRAVEAI